jgi:hypothetical protein
VKGQELKHLGQGAFAFSVATRLMTANEVEIQGQQVRVRRTSSKSLSMLTFTMEGRQFAAIEQNPTKPSRWGPLAAARAQSGCRSSLMNLRGIQPQIESGPQQVGQGIEFRHYRQDRIPEASLE